MKVPYPCTWMATHLRTSSLPAWFPDTPRGCIKSTPRSHPPFPLGTISLTSSRQPRYAGNAPESPAEALRQGTTSRPEWAGEVNAIGACCKVALTRKYMFLMIAAAHVAEIGGVPVRRRFNAIWPSEFDALVLSDGSRLSVR